MAATNTEVWQQGRVVSSETVATDIKRIVLEAPLPATAEPGSHVDVGVLVDGLRQTRSYSIVNTSRDDRLLTISVLRTPSSRGGSVYLHGLSAGDPIQFTQPLQNFPLRVGAPDYLLLAGGIGITAIARMAEQLARRNARYALVYAGRRRAAMAYVDDLAALHGDRLAVHIDDEGTPLAVEDLISSAGAATELYMCGPIRLMDAVRRSWIGAGRDLPNLRFETFGNSGWFDSQLFTVSIPRLRVELVVQRNQSLLEALEAAGVDIMSDCRKGECGLCEVRVVGLDGVIDHRDVFYSERQRREQRKLCCCVSRVGADPSTTSSAAQRVDRPHLVLDVP